MQMITTTLFQSERERERERAEEPFASLRPCEVEKRTAGPGFSFVSAHAMVPFSFFFLSFFPLSTFLASLSLCALYVSRGHWSSSEKNSVASSHMYV